MRHIKSQCGLYSKLIEEKIDTFKYVEDKIATFKF